MDGERKKRKMESNEMEGQGEGEGEDDEDKCVEKFFALIRSTREVRHRLLSHGDAAAKLQEKRTGVEAEEKKEIGAWTPMFQLEDFMDGAQGRAAKDFPVIQAGPSSERKEEEEEEEEEREEKKKGNGGSGIDLNLSL